MELDEGDQEEENFANSNTADLIEKIRKLKLHVKQLRNVIHKSTTASSSHGSSQPVNQEEPQLKKVKKERPFNFDTHPRRHVALKVAYLGWDFQGLASQEDTEETIEGHFFNALLRTRLIQSRETSNYHRCGRTDKGVSAFDQVLSLDVRCKATSGIGVKAPLVPKIDGIEHTKESGSLDEINYPLILNRVLPKEIRVLAWAPVQENFSARYDCVQRTYKYLFPKTQLDTKLMMEAAKSLIGVHDFRNFCKLDTSGRKSTVREILSVSLEDSGGSSSWDIVSLVIKGRSFIWHQIRCILSILFLVGQGLEEPSIVSTLLDIKKHPKKPQYAMAVDFPLVLFQVDHGEIPWEVDRMNLSFVQRDFAAIALKHKLKASMIEGMLVGMEGMSSVPVGELGLPHSVDSLVMGVKPKVHRPILSRPVNEKGPEEYDN